MCVSTQPTVIALLFMFSWQFPDSWSSHPVVHFSSEGGSAQSSRPTRESWAADSAEGVHLGTFIGGEVRRWMLEISCPVILVAVIKVGDITVAVIWVGSEV